MLTFDFAEKAQISLLNSAAKYSLPVICFCCENCYLKLLNIMLFPFPINHHDCQVVKVQHSVSVANMYGF